MLVNIKKLTHTGIQMAIPLLLNYARFAPYLRAFFLFAYDMHTMKLNLGMIKQCLSRLEQEIKKLFSSDKKKIIKLWYNIKRYVLFKWR